MCEHIGVLEVPKILSQDSVEALEIVPQERISDGTCEQIGITEVPKNSSQESVEGSQIFSLRCIFLRGCVIRFVLLKCPRTQPRKVSRQSK